MDCKRKRIDFDEASRQWRKNKISTGNGTFRYKKGFGGDTWKRKPPHRRPKTRRETLLEFGETLGITGDAASDNELVEELIAGIISSMKRTRGHVMRGGRVAEDSFFQFDDDDGQRESIPERDIRLHREDSAAVNRMRKHWETGKKMLFLQAVKTLQEKGHA